MKPKSALMILLVAFLLPVDAHPAEKQRVFHSKANGYSVAIPEGWTIIADSGVQDSINGTLTEDGKEAWNFEAVIAERPSTEVGFEYPYLLINVQRYSEATSKRQLTKNEIAYYLKTSTGLDVDDAVKGAKEVVADDVGPEVSDSTTRRVHLEEGRLVYRHRFGGESGRAGVGRFQAEILGHMGKYAAVQLMFYSLESDWSRLDDERKLMFGSFVFDEGRRYEDADSTDSRRTNALGRGAARGLVYGLVHLLVGVYLLLLAYRVVPRKPKDPEKMELWHRKFGTIMKIVSLYLIIRGILSLLGVLD